MSKLSALIAALEDCGIHASAEEIAEALWLCDHITATMHAAQTPLEQRPEGVLRVAQDQPQAAPRTTPDTTPGATPGTTASGAAPASQIKQRGSAQQPVVHAFLKQPGQRAHGPRPRIGRIRAGAISFRSPTVRSLPNALGIARALRPLRRHIPSPTNLLIDDQKTVERIANERLWSPVLVQGPVRWLDVAIIVDDGPSLSIWKRLVTEFRQLLENQGFFRDVRIWTIGLDSSKDQVFLHAGFEKARERRPRSPKTLYDPLGNRLILVISDFVSPVWWSQAAKETLVDWGSRMIVAAVQLLPRRLWLRTSLRTFEEVAVSADKQGLPNRHYLVSNARARKLKLPPGNIPLPVFTLEAESLGTLAQLVTGQRQVSASSLILWSGEREADPPDETAPTNDARPVSPHQRVQMFRAASSPLAFQLACLFAGAPLSLPIMHLIQRLMLPESRQIHLAEVFLGGLLVQITPPRPDLDPEHIQYDFHEGVRDTLLAALPMSRSLQVLEVVSNFIMHNAGSAIDFPALLAAPNTISELVINENTQPFARVAASVLRRLGGKYSDLADWLEQQDAPAESRGPQTGGEQKDAGDQPQAAGQGAADKAGSPGTAEGLSQRQEKILNYIREFTKKNGYPPSIRDIQKDLNITSTSVVAYNLKALQDKGHIARDGKVSRGKTLPKLTPENPFDGDTVRQVTVPVLGNISEGVLSEDVDEIPSDQRDTVYVSGEFGIGEKASGVYALRVLGQSLLGALIDDGDVILVKSQAAAQNGKTVIVRMNDEDRVIVARIYNEGYRVRLQFADPTQVPIFAEPDTMQVLGQVIGVLRSMFD